MLKRIFATAAIALVALAATTAGAVVAGSKPAQAASLPSGVSFQTAATGLPAGIVPVHTAALSQTASNKLKSSWSWYIARASGIVAAILLAILVISGVGLLTGLTYRLLEPLPAWAIHRAVALSFGVMVLVHIIVLLFDKYVGFSVADLLVPFASKYQPALIAGHNFGSLWVALGVMALYAIIVVILTSLFWMQSRPKPWRALHYLSYAILVMVFFHGLFVGTDLKHGLMRFLWIIGAFGLGLSIATRLRRAGTIIGGAKHEK